MKNPNMSGWLKGTIVGTVLSVSGGVARVRWDETSTSGRVMEEDLKIAK